MSDVKFDLDSEPYSPSGNLAADGVRKLLGAPSIDLVQTVVREAVQNSCDAAEGDGNAEIHFRLRTLSQDQLALLRQNIFLALPEDKGADTLRKFLKSRNPRVLEICDFGTRGLAGPTRADVALGAGEPTDFIDFLRNVGSPRNTHHGGGTYGYGKTSLYLTSKCSTILVDTLSEHRRKAVRRLIGARLGYAYDAKDNGGKKRRYTGRHWWGVKAADGIVDPLEGREAASLATALGFPVRKKDGRGTSIMILDPIFDGEDDARAIAMIQEALLWFFWPRLLESTPEDRRMRFHVHHEGMEKPLPKPEEFPPLDLFARAMTGLRNNDPGTEDIRSKRPLRHLGKLNVAKGLAGERLENAGGEGSLFPRRSAAVAVMRDVELVVRYYQGTPYPDDRLEWAGVFVASDDDEVEAAFAKAEPPAHDDWQASSITDKTQATIVRVAVREITRIAAEVAIPVQNSSSGNGEGPSLAAVAGILGRGLAGQGRDGAGERAGGSGGSVGPRRNHRVSVPAFVRLEQSGDDVIAVYSATVTTDGSRDNVLQLDAALALDGGSIAGDADLGQPRIAAIRHEGRELQPGTIVNIGALGGPFEIDVVIPGERAVVLAAAISGAESGA